MLEDGEIDDEDLKPTELELNAATVESVSASAGLDNDTEHQLTNKRKTRDTKLNKRKKMAKNPAKQQQQQRGPNFANEANVKNNSDEEDRDANTNDSQENFLNDYDSRFDNTFPNGDMDERVSKPKSLMSTNANPSSWSTPLSKRELIEQKMPATNGPKSLFDLFLNTGSLMGANPSIDMTNKSNSVDQFIDPVVTEKENSKPNKFNKNNRSNGQQQPQQLMNRGGFQSNELKRKSDDEAEPNSSQLISIEAIEKKMEKKRKFNELQKEKQKLKEAKQLQQQTAPVREPILCKFFMEGRCQKGNECPFSHNAPINKKLEPCKYYLNGFCAKNDKCMFMHAEFPCKFFHRNKTAGNSNGKSSCLHGDQCRFSHEPILNPLLLEAFNKHLNGENSSNHNEDVNKKPTTSLLGSPPHSLPMFMPKNDAVMNEAPIPSLMSLMSVNLPPPPPAQMPPKSLEVGTKNNLSPGSLSQQYCPSSPPPVTTHVGSLMGAVPLIRVNTFNKKQPLLATPTNILPSLLNNSIGSATYGNGMSQDVDERSMAAIPLGNTNGALLPNPITHQSNDIDERSLMQRQQDMLLMNAPPPPPPVQSTQPLVNGVDNESLKQELIIKIMKSIADSDSGHAGSASLPKHTLTELLVKLLNDKESLLGTDVILNLLATLGPSKPNSSILSSSNHMYADDDDKSNNLSLNESNSNLQIDLNSHNKHRTRNFQHRKKIDDGISSDYDDEYDEEYDDPDSRNELVIEGNCGEIEYKLIELELEPSELWSTPPKAAAPNPVSIISSLTGMSDPSAADQECDPRIKYYANQANRLNLVNFQTQLQQQNQLQLLQMQQQMTPTSPSSSSNNSSNTTIVTQQHLINTGSNSLMTLTSSLSSSVSTNGTEVTVKSVKATSNRIVDPRLAGRNVNMNNSSPTRSISPNNINNSAEQFLMNNKNLSQATQNDLISIQNRQLASSSLLSALPDFQFPKEQISIGQKMSNSNNMLSYSSLITQQQQQQMQNDNSTVKLSIEDYKRKLQKPSGMNNSSVSLTNSTMSILSSLAASSSSSSSSQLDYSSASVSSHTNSSANNSLPSIPSYSVNLQAPQSLHELLRNFQSS